MPRLGEIVKMRLGILLLMAALPASQLAVPPPASAAENGSAQPPGPAFQQVGRYETGLGSESAEIVAFASDRMYVTNSTDTSIDIVDLSDPSTPVLVRRVDLSAYGASVTSVDARGRRLAAAVVADPPTDPGTVVVMDLDGNLRDPVTVGALPDSVAFTPDGRTLVVANEGEPDGYGPGSIDPEGTISLINTAGNGRFSTNVRRLPPRPVRTVGFRAFNEGQARHDELSPKVRIFGPGASVAQDLEPEGIAFSRDSRFAYITLQENNALATIDIETATVVKIKPLGLKKHDRAGQGLDPSDRDAGIEIARWPVHGMYQPDGVASFRVAGETYLVTANEGDARSYDGFDEEAEVGDSDYVLAPDVFPDAAALKEDAALGRLKVTTATGDTDGDGEFEQIHAYGARSLSIRSATGRLIWDSGDQLEQITADAHPGNFNSDHEENDFDDRSDNKGPEPEGAAAGKIDGRAYAFVGLERIGGAVVYDVTEPRDPTFVQYLSSRDFTADPVGPDSGPEGLEFVGAGKSPSGRPLLLVAHEVSGTVAIWEAGDPAETTLSLLHNNDGESSLLPLSNTVNPGTGYPNTSSVNLAVAGVAAFKTVTDREIRDARGLGNAVLNVYAGDSFLASATLACSLPPEPDSTPIYDAVAQRRIAYDAHVFGNHEFDYGPDFLERFIRQSAVGGVLDQPFLSANLDFGAEPGFADLIDADGLIEGETTDGRVVARSAIVSDPTTAQRFGIIGATTPTLPTVSTPRDVTVTPDLESTAEVIQAEVDRLESRGIDRIILVSHLQDVANDRSLVALLDGVDIAVAGGGDELLANPAIPDNEELLPGETQAVAGTYPLQQTDAAGRTVYIVTTAGNYKYLGRLDATFDAEGEVVAIDAQRSFPRRVIPAEQSGSQIGDLGIEDEVGSDAGLIETVVEPVQACLAEFAATPVARSEVVINVARGSGSPYSLGVRSGETNGGNLVADSYISAYDEYAADSGLPARDPATAPVIAVQNGGGIRQNAGNTLPQGGAPGVISRLDTLNVLSFDNFLVLAEDVSAADLKTILERACSSIGGGQFLQIAQFEMTCDVSQPVGSRVSDVVFTNGTATTADDFVIVNASGVVQPVGPFGIVTNQFTGNGGDSYPTFAAATKTQLLTDAGEPIFYEQSLREYLETFPETGSPSLPTIPASDGRYAAQSGEGRITLENLP
ncbi:MAG: choice-of-anchor I family protein [Chloroflexota bacterium]|nr:choice-of-anchor I family protein [Chloroflexota bacterium]